MRINPTEAHCFFTNDLRCFTRHLITAICRPRHFGDKPPALDRFEPLIYAVHYDYWKLTGDRLPAIGVAALNKFDPHIDDVVAPRWPHAHLLIQNWLRDPQDPILNFAAYRRIGRDYGLDLRHTRHKAHWKWHRDGETIPTDTCLYTADHLRSSSARILIQQKPLLPRRNFVPKNARERQLWEKYNRPQASWEDSDDDCIEGFDGLDDITHWTWLDDDDHL